MVAISAALIYKKIHLLVLLIASLAASQKVENIGNSRTINKINILKSIDHLLKWKKFYNRAGYVGSYLADNLVQKGYFITVFDLFIYGKNVFKVMKIYSL